MEHHEEECEFLIQTIQKMAKELYEYRVEWTHTMPLEVDFGSRIRLNAAPSGFHFIPDPMGWVDPNIFRPDIPYGTGIQDHIY
jgi:hypothetical protein